MTDLLIPPYMNMGDYEYDDVNSSVNPKDGLTFLERAKLITIPFSIACAIIVSVPVVREVFIGIACAVFLHELFVNSFCKKSKQSKRDGTASCKQDKNVPGRSSSDFMFSTTYKKIMSLCSQLNPNNTIKNVL